MPLCDGDKSVAIEITTHCSLAGGLVLVGINMKGDCW